MANTVSLLSYANTFGDWVVTTNALAKENNDIAANNYVKPSGTLFLNDATLGLQVANNAIIAGSLQSVGLGSSAYVQNNLRVDQQVYFTNTSLGLTNAGQANINGLLIAQGPGTGLYVANNATIGGTLTIGSLETVGGSLTISGQTNINNKLQVTGATTISNTISVTGTTNIANDITITGNTSLSRFLTVSNDITAQNINAYGSVNIQGSTVNAINAQGNFQSLTTTGAVTVGGNFVITGQTVYAANTFIVSSGVGSAITSYFGVYRPSSSNAYLRWNETQKYWDLNDVNNNNYYRILTDEYKSDLTTISSPTTVATSNTVFYLQAVANTSNTNITNLTTYAQAAYNKANTGSGTFNGTTGQAVANNGVFSFSSNNGVVISGVANTMYFSTSQDIRTTASPTFTGLTSNTLTLNAVGTAPTPATTVSNTQIATTGFVNNLANSGYTFAHNISGNANSATVLQTGRTINGVLFDGSKNIILPSDASLLTGSTLSSNVTNSSLTSVGTISNGTWAGLFGTVSGANLTNLTAGNLTGTIPSSVLGNSTHYIGTTAITLNRSSASQTLTGVSIDGNSATVTNGVYTTGSYANPSWITSLDYSKLTNIPPSYNQSLNTTNNVQFNSLGVGAAATGTAGEIVAINNITAYYSDERLKTKLGNIDHALDKVMSLNGFYHEANEIAQSLGYEVKREVGVSAQEVQAVMPEVVAPAPIDNQYLTVRYERLVPLLIEAIKELKAEIDTLKSKT
jgi:hypothetical protein